MGSRPSITRAICSSFGAQRRKQYPAFLERRAVRPFQHAVFHSRQPHRSNPNVNEFRRRRFHEASQARQRWPVEPAESSKLVDLAPPAPARRSLAARVGPGSPRPGRRQSIFVSAIVGTKIRFRGFSRARNVNSGHDLRAAESSVLKIDNFPEALLAGHAPPQKETGLAIGAIAVN